jgi:hypothetical protein
MKFKIGLTISAETLFGLIAKMLPIEDLQVEEVPERLETKVEKIAQLSGPKIRPPRPRGNRFNGPILDGGGNKIVMDLLSDGKGHSARELKGLFEAGGYAPSGVGSRLDKLRDANVIHQPEYGLWQIGEAPKRKVASG